MHDSSKGKTESDILFSRSVKAGKRVYYFDVKQDRNRELYLSITESKRIKDGDEDTRPVFEKHKIFLYREDMGKFLSALQAAANFTQENGPTDTYFSNRRNDFHSDGQLTPDQSEEIRRKAERDYDASRKILDDFSMDF